MKNMIAGLFLFVIGSKILVSSQKEQLFFNAPVYNMQTLESYKEDKLVTYYRMLCNAAEQQGLCRIHSAAKNIQICLFGDQVIINYQVPAIELGYDPEVGRRIQPALEKMVSFYRADVSG